ncbi:MAG: hypothetical protein KBE23_12940 [Chloroflexi bacterium]|nr:hypothetical protein [Chloroflexota bacterium]MBP7043645.1 hypothetical protein [Chloroflexota bacterium]
MKTRFFTFLFVVSGFVLFVVPVYGANIFTETFNSLIAGTPISTVNTSFDYVRIGSGGGSITAEQAASGEMHMRLGGASGSSLNGVGIQNSFGGSNVVTLNFRIRLEDTLGTVFVGMGSGNTFTTNSTFATADLMWGIQSNAGSLQYRTTTWNNLGQNLSPGSNYEFHIVANRSGTTINYGSYSVANGTMDLFINGTLVGNDIAITNNQNVSGFRIYQVNGSSYARIDSITIDNTALEPYAPTAVSLQSFTSVNSQNTPLILLGMILVILLGGTAVLYRRQYRFSSH